MLRYRLITGPVLIALLTVFMWLDVNCGCCEGCLPFGVLLTAAASVFAFFGGVEMTKLLDRAAAHDPLTPVAGGLGAMAMTIATWLVLGGADVPAGVLVIVPLGAVMAALLLNGLGRRCSGSVHPTAAAALSTVWVGGGLGVLCGITALAGWHMLVLVVAVTKCADIGAYTVGCTIGRHKLIPWVSPGKTWEGLAGGIVFAIAATMLFFECVMNVGNPAMHDSTAARLGLEAVLGTIIAITGLGGDLSVSMLKRDAGVKDSGRGLPGMGGVLDVLDSLLVAAPVMWVIMQIMH